MHNLYRNVFDNAILRGLRQTMMGEEGAYLPHTPRPPQADGLAAGENPLSVPKTHYILLAYCDPADWRR